IVSEGTLAHAQATSKLAKTQAEATLEAQKYNSASTITDKVEQEKKAIELERQSAVTAANDILAAKTETYNKEIKAAGSNVQKKKAKEKEEMQSAKDMLALHQMSARDIQALEIAAVRKEEAAEVDAYKRRIKALDKFAKDYEKKVAEYQAKITAIEKKGDEDVDQIKHNALMKQLTDIQQAETQMYDSIATNVAKSIVE